MASSDEAAARYAKRAARRAHERFIAAHMGGIGARVYGVRDRAQDAWYSSEKFTFDDAESRATELNAQYTMTGRRPSSDARRVEPARRVEVEFLQWTEWSDGLLDCWIRQTDGWYGHVHTDGREPRWYPAERLRPADGAKQGA